MIAAIGPAGAADLLSRPIVLVVALAILSLLPFAFMSVTAFVKIATVLQIVRSAIGAQSVPSNAIVMTLAGALTLLAMAPVGDQIAARAAPILSGKELPGSLAMVRDGIDAVREPMREFLKSNATALERTRFLEVARQARGTGTEGAAGASVHGAAMGAKGSGRSEGVRGAPAVEADDLTVLVPAFVVTQLTEAFAIGFLIYLPFLVIDLVVSNVLLALGMQMMSPSQVSLPFKLLLFVAIDGWGLLSRSLVSGYHGG